MKYRHMLLAGVVATTRVAAAQPAPDQPAPTPPAPTPLAPAQPAPAQPAPAQPAPTQPAPDQPAQPAPDQAPPARPAPARPVPKPCTGTIDIHAVDATTHTPVVAATVIAGDSLLGLTDDNGRLVATGQCDGDIALSVSRDDYKTGEQTVHLVHTSSVELALETAGEVIEVREKAPPPPEMRAETKVSGEALERSRGKAFTEAIKDVPGVSELKSSTGVAKPIIRGQFGRRLLMLVDGVRHRAQEWGLEHAPEIDPFIADAIRVVRGAGGVRYGADAIGGVVLVDPPELRRDPGYNGEVHAIGSSNGRGGALAARLQTVLDAFPKLSLQFEGTGRRLAAPRTPDYALDNTGAREWTDGITAGYRAAHADYKLSYRHYDADLGVCSCLRAHNIDDFYAQAQAGEPIGAAEFQSDFGIGRPYQAVAHDLALARGRWDLPGGTLTSTYSFQHDLRREYDLVRNGDALGAQFNFRLYTHEVSAVYAHDPIHLNDHWHLRGEAGLVATGQLHYYAGLHLIPNYRGIAGGAYATERLVGHTTDVEIGARYDALDRSASIEHLDFTRLVRSGQLAMDACSDPSADRITCGSTYHTFTATTGAAQRFGEGWAIKGDLSIAQRAPNPDEQYLNGTAPTFPVLGLGKPDIKPETTYSSSVTASFDSHDIKGEASAFANYVRDYIYFAPSIGDDGMPVFDVTIRGTFPRFITRNVDATFYGADGGLSARVLPQLELSAQASLVRARDVTDDSYLVFVPADHYRGTATYRTPELGGIRKGYITVSGEYVARQKRFDIDADFIPPPPAYFLLGAELGAETTVGGQKVRFALQGTNLTNARYRDYTSLIRYFADEPGWQVWLRTSLFFDSSKKGT